MTKGVIATPHYLASQVGAQILRDGGNAIDAAIAADAMLCVIYPHMTSLGGDLMALVWASGANAPVGLIGAGRSGELATIAAVRERGHDAMPARRAFGHGAGNSRGMGQAAREVRQRRPGRSGRPCRGDGA